MFPSSPHFQEQFCSDLEKRFNRICRQDVSRNSPLSFWRQVADTIGDLENEIFF